jgi:hypothetical protein
MPRDHGCIWALAEQADLDQQQWAKGSCPALAKALVTR